MQRFLVLISVLGVLGLPAAAAAQNPHLVTYEGDAGPGHGKHIVFLAGDHEYRSEETLPELARILAKHYGFKCSVFITTNPQTGTSSRAVRTCRGSRRSTPRTCSSSRCDSRTSLTRRCSTLPITWIEAGRWSDYAPPPMRSRSSARTRSLRSSTGTALPITPAGSAGRSSAKPGSLITARNHVQSSLLIFQPEESAHPILRGVKDVWVQSGGYTAAPIEGSHILAKGRILNGMTPDSPPATDKQEQPVAWYRSYTGASGRSGRVFTTTHGASEDLLNAGFRRMVVNACLWGAGLESRIQPDGDISFVGPYHPSTFAFGGHVKGIRPCGSGRLGFPDSSDRSEVEFDIVHLSGSPSI